MVLNLVQDSLQNLGGEQSLSWLTKVAQSKKKKKKRGNTIIFQFTYDHLECEINRDQVKERGVHKNFSPV